jgi:hypothetical protein
MIDTKNKIDKKLWSAPILSELNINKTNGAQTNDTGEEGDYVDPASGL